MSADFIYAVTMPSLRDFAERCRRLALTVRSEAVRKRLLAMAQEMERQAGANDHAAAAESSRKAG